eukprot:2742993-Rhodomonas_salina.1
MRRQIAEMGYLDADVGVARQRQPQLHLSRPLTLQSRPLTLQSLPHTLQSRPHHTSQSPPPLLTPASPTPSLSRSAETLCHVMGT